MPLSNKDLSDIAMEFGAAKDDAAKAKDAIPNIEEQVVKTQAQADRQWILYRNAQNERVSPYQIERRWLDGTTYTDITEQQITDAGSRTPSNIFFPTSWSKTNAQLTTSGNGNPTSTSPNSESAKLNDSVANQGLISQINLLRNGQSSGVGTNQLDAIYSPGAPSITLVSGTQTVGKFLYISGSGTSALVLVTGASGINIDIQEIIAPASSIAIGGNVVENIPGFSNAERQTLTSGSYQNILTQLTNRIATTAGLWNTAMSNQLAQLNINIDSPSQINAAKTSVQNGQSAYSTWNALSNTGVNGKYVNTSLDDLANNGYTPRNSNISTRVSQITTALGSVSQNAEGDYSGNGQYLQRFKCMNYLINSADGPLFQLNGLNSAKTTFKAKVANVADKLATYSNLVRYGAFTTDSAGTSVVKVDGASQFAVSDNVLVTGNGLPSIQATITNISGSSVTLNQTVPKEFKKAAKAGIIKAI